MNTWKLFSKCRSLHNFLLSPCIQQVSFSSPIPTQKPCGTAAFSLHSFTRTQSAALLSQNAHDKLDNKHLKISIISVYPKWNQKVFDFTDIEGCLLLKLKDKTSTIYILIHPFKRIFACAFIVVVHVWLKYLNTIPIKTPNSINR